MDIANRTARPVLALALVSVLLAGCSVLESFRRAPVSACDAQIDRGVLPEWARAGFSETEPRVAHVVGRRGDIVAILFGDPLSAPPATDHDNKILWVAKRIDGGSPDLSIAAQRMDGSDPVGDVVERTVPGGPGPSIIDLPAPGCWRLSLSWDGQSDALELEYVGPSPSSSP